MTWTGVVRWGLRGFGALLVLVLAWLLVGRIYAARRLDAAREAFKQNVGPLELAAWASPPVPDEENAAIPIRSGALGLVLSDADRTLIGELTRNPTGTMTAEQVAGLRRILDANKAALEMIGTGAKLGRSNFGTELRVEVPRLDADGKPRLDTIPRSPLIGIMYAARILRARARLERVEGDREQMLSTNETVFGLARAVYQEPRTISHIIANAVERIGLGEVAVVATSDSTTPAELQRMQAMLLANDLRAAWKRVRATETLDSVARVESALSFHATPDHEANLWDRAGRVIWRPFSQATLLELGTELVGLLDQPAGLRGPAPEESTGRSRLRLRLMGIVRPFWATKEIIRSLGAPNLHSAAGRLQATMAQRTLVRLVLALRLEGLTSGTYPPDLSGFPDAAGPDPFTGKPLAYERKADGSAVLAIPDGEALWKQVTNGMPTPCPFSVNLPPPLALGRTGGASSSRGEARLPVSPDRASR